MPFKTRPVLYAVWGSMKRRCYSETCWNFQNYGGRGIKVCDQWVHSYKTFERDMLPRPPGTTIERIDNDGDYSPENCRWATRKEQQRNQRVTRKIMVDGCVHVAVDLADLCGVKTDTIIERAQRGLSLESILSTTKLFNHRYPVEAIAAIKKKAETKTHCTKGHAFTPKNSYITSQGWKQCRKCHAERAHKRRMMKRGS